MSVEAVTKVASITTGDDKSKSVLMWLAFHLNEKTGLCCPSINLLRKEMEVGSDNTVRAALTRLRERGLVSWTREIEDGVIKRTLYTLHLDASTVAPTSTTEPHSITDVPQPLKGGPSMAEQGSLNGCAGVPQPVNGNKEIEHGIEQGKEQGSVLPAPLEAETPCVDTNPNPAPLDDVPFPDFEEPTTEELFVIVDAPDPKAEAKPKAKRTRAMPKTRCPFDERKPVLPADWLTEFEEDFPSINVPTEFRSFVSYHVSKGSAFANWKSAFRNWLNNAIKYQAREAARSGGAARPTPNFKRALQREDMVYTDDF